MTIIERERVREKYHLVGEMRPAVEEILKENKDGLVFSRIKIELERRGYLKSRNEEKIKALKALLRLRYFKRKHRGKIVIYSLKSS